jgi:hypothetical protein
MPNEKEVSRREWNKIVDDYDSRTGNVAKSTPSYRKPKNSTGQGANAKSDLFVRGRRVDGSGWAGRRQK